MSPTPNRCTTKTTGGASSYYWRPDHCSMPYWCQCNGSLPFKVRLTVKKGLTSGSFTATIFWHLHATPTKCSDRFLTWMFQVEINITNSLSLSQSVLHRAEHSVPWRVTKAIFYAQYTSNKPTVENCQKNTKIFEAATRYQAAPDTSMQTAVCLISPFI